MITVHVPKSEFFDEAREIFIEVPETSFKMEHSLVSLRDWEAKWKIPFFHTEKTAEQLFDYLKIMTITENVDDLAYQAIPKSEMKRVVDYIQDKQTAMTINDALLSGQKKSNEFVTAETIYWWMITLGIPIEYETRHLEQLLALIKFISIKNDPKKKKMSEKDVIKRNAEINARNRAKYGIKG